MQETINPNNFTEKQRKEILRQYILSNFWLFVNFMDVRDESDPTKKLIPDIPLYKGLCHNLQYSKKDTMILLPRKFRKSLLTSQLFSIWHMLKYPNRTIGILTATYDLVTAITTGIKNFFENHEGLKDLFPEVKLTKATDKEIKLSIRTTTRKEPNLKAFSIDSGRFAGFRADLLIFDDVVDDNWLGMTEHVKKKQLQTFYGAFQMRETTARMFYLGTRYNHDDIAGELIKRNEFTGNWKIFIESVYDESRNAKFPEIMDIDEIKSYEDELPPAIFSAQYLNSPIVGENAIFKVDTYKRYATDVFILKKYLKSVVIGVDLAVMKSRDKGDFSTAVAVGLDNNGIMYLLDATDTRTSIEDLYNQIELMCELWKPREVIVEAISGFRFAYNRLVEKSRERNAQIPFRELSRQKDNKNLRIESGLEHLLRNGTLQLPSRNQMLSNPSLKKLVEKEMIYFDKNNANNLDDLLDAFEIAVRHLKHNNSTLSPRFRKSHKSMF